MIHRFLGRLRRRLGDAQAWRSARRDWDVAPYDPAPQALDDARGTLERILTENILPFWYPRTIDAENGGFRINHDERGEWVGQGCNRHLVSQSRTAWFFARLTNSAHRSDGHSAAARHGFEFLRDRLWDEEFGGFFWEVDGTGRTPIKLEKHLYGQSFGLYALAEYAIATQDAQAVSMARTLYGLLERHAHDGDNGGYREFLHRDWRPAEPSAATYMEDRADLKQFNTHLHVLEAFTRYYHLVQEPEVRNRLTELILIMSNAVVRKPITGCRNAHDDDWTPQDPATSRVTYGHDLENIWLLIEACEAVGLPNALLCDLYETLFYNAWRFGFDHRHGGVFYQGPPGKFAAARQKIWWVQAESLLCALHMHRLTRKKAYFRCFTKTLEWTTRYQIDWNLGEWHRRISPTGVSSGKKSGDEAGAWKAPYHNGRAIIRCLELVSEEQARSRDRM
ncbi:MAG TPA: AGE family epimerase/isomerase [Gammaproteobacteria bacterium]|nr:AGE family epimerase/isomerase [Gammaproteobacteria bacterium]